jgi:hypothetical protein
MNEKSKSIRDKLKEFLAEKLKKRDIPIWKRKTEEADQQIVLRGSIDFGEGVDFYKKPEVSWGVFYKLRYSGDWLRRKLKGVFK